MLETWMRHGPALVAVSVLSGHADVAAAAAAEVRVAWVDVNLRAPCTPDVDAVAREVRRIFRAMDIAVGWRRGVAGEAIEPGELSAVALFTDVARRPRPVMGSASPGSGTAWIFCDTIAANLARRPSPAARDVDLGVAIGRVLAHELIHVLAPRLPHAPAGLMAARWEPSLLTRRGLLGEARVREAVRRSLFVDQAGGSADGIASLVSSDAASRQADVIAPRRGCHERFLY